MRHDPKQCGATTSLASRAISRRPLLLLRILQLLLLLRVSPAAGRCELTAEPKSQNIATTCHPLSPFSSSMFAYPNVRQCFAITVLLSGFVSKSATFSSLLTLRTRSLWDLISSCTHKYATPMCFNFPIPCLWRMCSVVFASMASTDFTAKPSHTSCSFASDAPNAAAYSSASALLFAMTFCLRVCAFRVFPNSFPY